MEKKTWQILRPLASGGMGEVHLARTPEGQAVVVKTLPSSQRTDLGFFEQEARLLSKLRHPAIVSIGGYATDSAEIFGADHGPCYWMEYVEGQDILSASKSAEPDRIFQWMTQALEALKYLHSQKILHGDLSSKNVLIDVSGS